MPRFTVPTVALHSSFLAAAEEFAAEGWEVGDTRTTVAEEIEEYAGIWESPEGFQRYVARVRAAEDARTPWHPGWVACTTLWWADGATYLGRLSLRHRLTPRLREEGGHIGYEVRPSARRQGHATAMLRASLPYAKRLGHPYALVTCDRDNTGSRKAIEKCGGVPEDPARGAKLRYWIATA